MNTANSGHHVIHTHTHVSCGVLLMINSDNVQNIHTYIYAMQWHCSINEVLNKVMYNLTHQGWVTHICNIKQYAIIGSDTGLAMDRWQGIISTNEESVVIVYLREHVSLKFGSKYNDCHKRLMVVILSRLKYVNDMKGLHTHQFVGEYMLTSYHD